jgi:hypothetical protein
MAVDTRLARGSGDELLSSSADAGFPCTSDFAPARSGAAQGAVGRVLPRSHDLQPRPRSCWAQCRSRCRLGSAPPRPPAGQRGAPHVPAGSILPGHLFGSLQRILPGSRSPPRWRDDQHEDAALRSVIDERLSVSPAAIAAKAYAPRECGQESGSVGVAQCPLRSASDQIVRGCKMTRCAKRRHRLAHSMTASTGAESWTQRCLKRRCRRAHRRFDR